MKRADRDALELAAQQAADEILLNPRFGPTEHAILLVLASYIRKIVADEDESWMPQ